MSKIIGIDLGTTNSAFAHMVAGKPEVIANAEGNRTTPSVVAVSKKGDRLVGQIAQRQRVTNPKDTIYGVKRLIGRKFSDKEAIKFAESHGIKCEKYYKLGHVINDLFEKYIEETLIQPTFV